MAGSGPEKPHSFVAGEVKTRTAKANRFRADYLLPLLPKPNIFKLSLPLRGVKKPSVKTHAPYQGFRPAGGNCASRKSYQDVSLQGISLPRKPKSPGGDRRILT
jgi:hypothetical protein